MKHTRKDPRGLGTRSIAWATALAAVLMLAGCAAVTPGDGQSVEKGHPFRAEKLKAVMRSFDQSVRRGVPEETDQFDRWEGVFPKIADEAAALGDSAKALAGRPPKGLEIPERARFAVLAQALGDAARTLEEAAARGDADAVAIARADVGLACRNCHARYRPDSPGVPDAFR
jgi:cytochrome c556